MSRLARRNLCTSFFHVIVQGVNREFIFDDDFILYLKEADKEKPYFALKVDNLVVLVESDN